MEKPTAAASTNADAGPDWDGLFAAAKTAATNAYAPYSSFHVGAAVLAASGSVFTGANVENAAYPVGICAEAAALGAARTAEGQGLRIEAIAIYAETASEQVGCNPCGACRQRIMELAPRAQVAFFDASKKMVARPAADLLPDAFGL